MLCVVVGAGCGKSKAHEYPVPSVGLMATARDPAIAQGCREIDRIEKGRDHLFSCRVHPLESQTCAVELWLSGSHPDPAHDAEIQYALVSITGCIDSDVALTRASSLLEPLFMPEDRAALGDAIRHWRGHDMQTRHIGRLFVMPDFRGSEPVPALDIEVHGSPTR